MSHTHSRAVEHAPRNGGHGYSPSGVGAVAVLATTALLAGALAYGGRRHEVRPPDSAPARARRGRPKFNGYDVVGRTVTINRPRADVYRTWRDFARLPSFMENVRAVKPVGDDRMVWTIAAPGGTSVDIETQVVTDRTNEVIAWRSVEGSDIDTEGRVAFRDAPGGRGTEVEAIIAYKAPGGELGRLIAALFQREPAIQGRRELKRLKMLLETGEISTSKNHRKAA